MENKQRREFLKKSLLGVSAAAFAPGIVSAATNSDLSGQQDLMYRTLGKTGLELPVISLGTSNVNNPNFIYSAMDSGIRLFTTSSYYREGNNEVMLGEVFKNRPRDSFYIATGSMPDGVDHQNGVFTKPEAADKFIADVEGGLKRMGLEYVDIIFLPFVAKRESVFFEPFLRMMEDFKKQGKTRFIGIASHSYTSEALRAAADTGIYDIAMPAYNFRKENTGEIEEAIAYAKNKGMGIVGMKSQAGGFWDKERTLPINSKATIKWVLQNENITTVLSGMSTVEQLNQNVTLMKDIKLSDQEMKDLRLTSAEHVPGLYCRQCRQCLSQCPGNYDIPTAMRSYMYAYGYQHFKHAKETLGYANIPKNVCENCTECTVNCAVGFDIKTKMQDIARLNSVPDEFLYV
ncbi:MAG: aldo/keto reductase [Bacteroidales bacterium]|nr:aldo/keto reductase [Bacteroidales bacterium]